LHGNIEKNRFLKLNNDKFVKQILTYPYSTNLITGWHLPPNILRCLIIF